MWVEEAGSLNAPGTAELQLGIYVGTCRDTARRWSEPFKARLNLFRGRLRRNAELELVQKVGAIVSSVDRGPAALTENPPKGPVHLTGVEGLRIELRVEPLRQLLVFRVPGV